MKKIKRFCSEGVLAVPVEGRVMVLRSGSMAKFTKDTCLYGSYGQLFVYMYRDSEVEHDCRRDWQMQSPQGPSIC